jgi:hypothetical protein
VQPEPTRAGIAATRFSLPAIVALLLVFLTYAPSLGNGWVWDDHLLIERGGGLSSWSALLTRDVWGPANGSASDLYRPLVMLTHALGQVLLPGPAIEHVVNLLLHLGVVACVAGLARRLGASVESAWVGAAIFGVHTGASEPVFWVTGRHDLAPMILLFAGWVALLDGKSWLAGFLLALTPFGKEPFLLAPFTVLLWGVARRSIDVRALLVSSAGSAAYVGIRTLLDLPLPTGAAAGNPLGALGGGASRFLELLVLPSGAAVTAPYMPVPAMGMAVVGAGVLLLLLAHRFPFLGGLLAAMPIWAPTALAGAQIGIAADRYAYILFATLGVAVAFALPRLGRVAWLFPLALAPITVVRGFDWKDDAAVFGADLLVDPTNPRAAFHVAWDLHQREKDCKAAIPLYQLALDVEPRAVTNLQACLSELKDWQAMVELGPRTRTVKGAMNTARAHAQLGQAAEAAEWARIATERDATSAPAWVLYAKALLGAGDAPGALVAADRALALNPSDSAVVTLREAVAERIASPPPADATPPETPAPPADPTPPGP